MVGGEIGNLVPRGGVSPHCGVGGLPLARTICLLFLLPGICFLPFPPDIISFISSSFQMRPRRSMKELVGGFDGWLVGWSFGRMVHRIV